MFFFEPNAMRNRSATFHLPFAQSIASKKWKEILFLCASLVAEIAQRKERVLGFLRLAENWSEESYD